MHPLLVSRFELSQPPRSLSLCEPTQPLRALSICALAQLYLTLLASAFSPRFLSMPQCGPVQRLPRFPFERGPFQLPVLLRSSIVAFVFHISLAQTEL